jgi:hypothetical protein
MKMLNLDALASKSARGITLFGVDYPVKQMTVQDFIEANKEAELIEAVKGDASASLEATIRMLKRTIPTLPETEVRNMSLELLGFLVQFINGELEAEYAKSETPDTGKLNSAE